MNPPFLHHGKRVLLQQTSLETVGSMLCSKHIPTKLRLGYLHSCLFRSSTPPGEEPIGPPLVDWDEVVYCCHGNRQRLHNVPADGCSCVAPSLPPATAAVVQAFITIIDGLVAARGTLDWSIPVRVREEELVGDETPNSSLLGEIFAEFERAWKVVIMRVPGAAPQGIPGPPPAWWSGRLQAAARLANREWLHSLRGSGAKGERPFGSLDRCDDVFNATGWVLQFDRLGLIQVRVES